MKVDELNGASLPSSDKDAREEFLDKKVGGKSLCATIDEVGMLSFVSFSWIFHYLWSTYKGRVDSTSQTCALLDSAGVNLGRMEHLWNEELKRNPTQPSLFRVTIRFMRHRLVVACLIFFFCLVFGFIGPTCLVKGLVSFTEGIAHNDDDEKSVDYVRGFIYTIAILMVGIKWFTGWKLSAQDCAGSQRWSRLKVELSRVLMYGATWAVSYRTGIRVRGALLSLLYKHLMNVKSMRGRTSAEIVNLFANDGQRLFDAVTFAPLVIMGPFVLVGGLIYLLRVIGTLSLLGILVFFVFDILQAVLGVTMVRCRNAAIKSTERRMGLMGEILRCIRVIKASANTHGYHGVDAGAAVQMNVWEELFIGRVTEIRREEKKNLRIAGYAQSLAIASSCVVPVVATFVTVLSVVLSGSDLLASDAFSAITVYFVMLFGIRMIPYGMRYLAEARSAIVRMQKLLLLEKCDSPASLQPIPISSTGSNGDAIKSPLAIRMEAASFSWEGPKAAQKAALKTNEEKGKKPVNEASGELLNGDIKGENGNCLKGLNLKIEKGELIGVCGGVGSGKSAFFHAITGHLCEEGGTMFVNGTVAYVSQVPFVLNATIRDNILFGGTMNSQRYYKAISASQLSKELESMPENEMSMVGERGTTLSGGQKSRVALARAIHSNRDIYLLDDIL